MIDKTDLSLVLSAAGLAVSIGLGRTAALLLAAFLAGRLSVTHRRDP